MSVFDVEYEVTIPGIVSEIEAADPDIAEEIALNQIKELYPEANPESIEILGAIDA
jgi:hypothetical protein